MTVEYKQKIEEETSVFAPFCDYGSKYNVTFRVSSFVLTFVLITSVYYLDSF
jgi:hypothetical protein